MGSLGNCKAIDSNCGYSTKTTTEVQILKLTMVNYIMSKVDILTQIHPVKSF